MMKMSGGNSLFILHFYYSATNVLQETLAAVDSIVRQIILITAKYDIIVVWSL